MSSSTFSQFSALPAELKIKILSIAASPNGGLAPHLDSDFLLSVGDYWSFSSLRLKSITHCRFFEYASPKLIGESCAFFDKRDSARVTVTARLSLLATCRLARQIALEEWKRDMERMVKYFYAPECADFVKLVAVDLVDLLDGLIEATKDGKAVALRKPPIKEQPVSTRVPYVTSVERAAAEDQTESRSARRRRRRREREQQRNAASWAAAT